MDYIKLVEEAIIIIEQNLTEEISNELLASKLFVSNYHFQRVFSVITGYTLGEYIRSRRMYLAGLELKNTDSKVIDIAVKYGYDSPDSFTKAFKAFHGFTPNKTKNNNLKEFNYLSFEGITKGDYIMKYEVVTLPEIKVTGISKKFVGVLKDRYQQQHDFMVDGNTRFVRYALQGMAKDTETEYSVISNITDDDYLFTIGSIIPEYFVNHLEKTVGNYKDLLSTITIKENKYIHVVTEKTITYMDDHLIMYKQLIEEWLPNSGYQIKNAPEITVMHHNKEKSYIEMYIPIE